MRHVPTLAFIASVLVACTNSGGGGSAGGSGGSGAKGGTSATGGGSSVTGGTRSGGSSATGGEAGSGGSSGGTTGAATGGSSVTGGTGSGGSSATGGKNGSGGSSGGTTVAATGGNTSYGGMTGNGGGIGTGGVVGTGGSSVSDAGSADVSAPEVANDLNRPADVASETGGDTTQVSDANVYKPCPTNGDPCKILPFGDSITWGVDDEGNAGYRGPLFALAVAAHQKITFTGSLSNGPTTVSGQPFPQQNEGHSGWTIDPGYGSYGAGGISSLVPTPAFNALPNTVLLMIGTNDVYASSGQSTMANRLGTLLDKIISTAPDALLVVAKITPLTTGGGYVDIIKAYNDAIPGLVQKRAGDGKHIVMVDMNTNFTVSTMLSSDGIHPNTAGYKFMADQWYAAIASLLPK